MKKFNLILLGLLLFNLVSAQIGKTYYVSSNVLNLRSEASTSSEKIDKLKKYDNVILLNDTVSSGWYKIDFNGTEGYVSNKYLKKGKAVVSVSEYRVGAVCKDGTSSTATGRGACSHHGGVSYWKTKKQESVRIIDE